MDIWDVRRLAHAAGMSMSWTVSDRPAGDGRPGNSYVIEPLDSSADSRWTIYYTEKGIDGHHEYFDTEDDACRWAAKVIEKDAALASAPVRVLTEQEIAKAAEVRKNFLEKMNIPDWKKIDPYAGGSR